MTTMRGFDYVDFDCYFDLDGPRTTGCAKLEVQIASSVA